MTKRINEPPWGRCLQGAVDARWAVVVVLGSPLGLLGSPLGPLGSPLVFADSITLLIHLASRVPFGSPCGGAMSHDTVGTRVVAHGVSQAIL